MATSYTHAHLFNATSDRGSAAANAAYNDLASLTVGLLLRWNGSTGNQQWNKGSVSSGISVVQLFDGRGDFYVQRATTGSIYRGPSITTDNTWRWVFYTLVRSSAAHTRHTGPKGGTLATQTTTDQNSGSGAVSTDASFPFDLGFNGGNSASFDMEYAFAGIWSSVLSLAQCQAVADDLSTAVQPVAAWKPGASDSATIPNYISGPPSMTMTSTALVAGPDATAGIAPGTRTLLAYLT